MVSGTRQTIWHGNRATYARALKRTPRSDDAQCLFSAQAEQLQELSQRWDSTNPPPVMSTDWTVEASIAEEPLMLWMAVVPRARLSDLAKVEGWRSHDEFFARLKASVETGVDVDGWNWTESQDSILDRLNDRQLSIPDRQNAVLIAETTAFDPSHVRRLLDSLAAFISEFRFTTDEEMTTVLGSAIRKYAMNMEESDFDAYAAWFEKSNSQSPSHHVQSELAKGAAWRMMYEPVGSSSRRGRLLTALDSLCRKYLKPGRIEEKNHASIVLNGIVAVVILEAVGGPRWRTRHLMVRAITMDVPWFRDLLLQRIKAAAEIIGEHSPSLPARFEQWFPPT
jgi:hypothetical protein